MHHAITAMVYLQDLCEDPSLAYMTTEGVRSLNDLAMQFLNSADQGRPR